MLIIDIIFLNFLMFFVELGRLKYNIPLKYIVGLTFSLIIGLKIELINFNHILNISDFSFFEYLDLFVSIILFFSLPTFVKLFSKYHKEMNLFLLEKDKDKKLKILEDIKNKEINDK